MVRLGSWLRERVSHSGLQGPLRGHWGKFNGKRLVGWLACEDSPEPRKVGVYVDGRLMRAVRADIERPDVKAARRLPTDRCGFSVRFHSGALRKLPASFELGLRDMETGKELSGSPQTLEGNPEIPVGTIPQNAHCEPYTLNKNGGLSVRFSDMKDATKRGLMRHAEQLLASFRELGHDAAISYGSLLGAVRGGGAISHDDDIDLVFIADAKTLEGAAEEFSGVLNRLRQSGYRVVPHNRGQAHIHGKIDQDSFCADTFLGWFDEEDRFYLNFTSKGVLWREQILPLRPVTFEGIDLPAPADREAVCAALYGENWRSPDPNFAWTPSEEVKAFFRQLNT